MIGGVSWCYMIGGAWGCYIIGRVRYVLYDWCSNVGVI